MPDWDKRYAEAELSGALFGRAPNNYVQQTMARPDFEARSALCLADGDGRNGRWLAGQGLKVTAVDISGVATAQAIAADEAAGVKVKRIVDDLKVWPPMPDDFWDAAFLIYLHCERDVRRRAVEMAARHLTPRGWFVAEGFAANQAGINAAGPQMGPPGDELRYALDEFQEWLPGFDVVEALVGVVQLDEGAKHQGLAPVVRFAARRGAALDADVWEEIDHDVVSGRRIFKADDEAPRRGYYGTYDFATAAKFEVRDADGAVLLRMSGSAKGEYWCGVFLWFVKGSDGRQVRLDESDKPEDEVMDVPDEAPRREG